MRDINNLQLTGRLTKDVDVRQVGDAQNGFLAVSCTLAVNRKSKQTANGGWDTPVDFIYCGAAGTTAQRLKDAKKGDQVFVASGELQSYNRDGKSGMQVKMNDAWVARRANANSSQPAAQNEVAPGGAPTQANPAAYASAPAAEIGIDISNDDLPF